MNALIIETPLGAWRGKVAWLSKLRATLRTYVEDLFEDMPRAASRRGFMPPYDSGDFFANTDA